MLFGKPTDYAIVYYHEKDFSRNWHSSIVFVKTKRVFDRDTETHALFKAVI